MVGLSTNNYGTSKFIVDSNQANGTHTTIAEAISAASSGDTIFIRPGTYTEDLTLKPGVRLFSYLYGNTNQLPVVITGHHTFSSSGLVRLSGIQFVTNSDYILELTGSNDSIVYFYECLFSVSNHTVFNLTSSSSSSALVLQRCHCTIGVSGYTLYESTGALRISVLYSSVSNSGLSTVVSNNSDGVANFRHSAVDIGLSCSGSGSLQIQNCINDLHEINTTAFETAGTGQNSQVINSYLTTGTAVPVVVGSGTTVQILGSNLFTTDGSGTLYTNSGTLDIRGTLNTAVSFATDGSSAIPTSDGILTIAGGTGITSSGSSSTITVDLDSPVDEINGGTGQTTYSTGDILYSSASNTLSKLIAGSDDQVLTLSSGVPVWSDASGLTNVAFQAYLPTIDSNQTGGGTLYTLGSGNALTEVFDLGGDFVTTGTFTAPVNGKYMLGGNIRAQGVLSAMTYGRIDIVTSNATYNYFYNPGTAITVSTFSNIITSCLSVLAEMDESDTYQLKLVFDGATDTADISSSSSSGGATRGTTCMWGYQVA